VHSYSCEVVEEAGRDCGLLLYSTQGGWAALDGEGGSECGDPRPANMDPQVSKQPAGGKLCSRHAEVELCSSSNVILGRLGREYSGQQ
jgi:hypothetical protein